MKKEDYLRYSTINCSLCISANVARKAAPMKPYIGHTAYTIQTVIEIIKKREEKFNVYVDKESLTTSPNSKYSQIEENQDGMIKIWDNHTT